MSDKTFKLGNNADGRFIFSDRFNTTFISFHFYLPLDAETMAEDALLPYLITSCSDKYRSFTELNLKLLRLYGAELSCSVSKSGDFLHTRLGINVINDSFAYDSENVVSDAASLLTSLIFEPAVSDNAFYKKDLDREKRKTIERIESEINNKRSYARTRLIELMFQNEAYGRFIYGKREEIERISEASVYEAWKRFLEKSYIQLNVIGKELPLGLFENVRKRLSSMDRSADSEAAATKPLAPANSVKRLTERMDVTQGKLVMGFQSELSGSLRKALPLLLFADVFGGGPYSRLFSNVREKQSLCYYCSASQRRSKGFIIVDSGVESANADKAESAILEELSVLKNGTLEDFRIESSKKSVIDSLLSYNDSAAALDMWYTRDICDEDDLTPEGAAALVQAVSKEDIINAAKGVSLHSVYRLLPKEAEA